MNEPDPSFSTEVLSWIINAVFAVALLVGRMTFNRHVHKSDEIESRLRKLEKDSVTHDDLRRLESKIDDHHRQISDRLDRILERG